MGIHSLPWTGSFSYHKFDADILDGKIYITFSFFFNTQTLSLKYATRSDDDRVFGHIESLDEYSYSDAIFEGIDNCNGFPP